jgi:hypothetical protein
MTAQNQTPELELNEAELELELRRDNWQDQEIVALWQDDEFAELEDGEELEW